MELDPRTFPQSPGARPAVHFARSLCHGAVTALCLCVIQTVASLPPHLVPLPTGTILAPPHPFLQPIGREPLPWGALIEEFPKPKNVFTYFLLLYGSRGW